MASLVQFPAELENALQERTAVAPGEPGWSGLARSVLRLSDRFNRKTDWDPDYASDPELRRAYLAYFLPVNVLKIRTPLDAWIRDRPDRWAGRPLRCLDLGSGPGTLLLGLCDRIRELPEDDRPARLDLVAADQSHENLREAEALVASLSRRIPDMPEIHLEALRTDVLSGRTNLLPLAATGGRFDLVTASNLVCELSQETGGIDEAERLLRTILREALASNGAILLIEPALRETSRSLHRLRDRVLQDGPLQVHAPCFHQESCPALRRDRDWCYAELPWQPPRIVKDLDRATGLRKDVLRFAYLVLSPEPAAPESGTWRVVSDVLSLKGEDRVWLCGEGRWIQVRQLHRTKKRAKSRLEGLRRGDRIEASGLVAGKHLVELPPDGELRRT